MYETELHFLSRTEMHSDDKWYVEKYKLYLNLCWLLAEIGGSGGDVAGGVAYRPTARGAERVRGSPARSDGRARRFREAAPRSRGLQQNARREDRADHADELK